MKDGVKIDGYLITISSEYNIHNLREVWLSIEDKIQVPFFLTWSWISCWLDTYSPNLIVVSASFNNKPIAIGLFTRSIQKRRGLITSRQIRLNQMGEPLQDQIWMEYNDFICHDEHRESAVNACLRALDDDSHWDEVILSMMSSDRAIEVARSNQHAVLEMILPCFVINLKPIRLGNKPYIDFLTRNTRYQIRRSIRLYKERYGEIILGVADSTAQALDFFHQAGPLHILRWDDSGYRNPQFVDFHENLIRRSFDENIIKMLKISAGNETIAIIYYHVSNSIVYFYLHGLRYENNSKFKPGLVAHSIATQYFVDQGMDKYDFMGGYSQYKEQLADISENLVTVAIQRPRSRFKVENLARNIKDRITATK